MGFNTEFVHLLVKCASISIGAILGVITRVGVDILFGPTRADITSREGVLFFNLPGNVIGCFVMGMHGSVKSAWHIPPTISLGLSIGYAGSLTTFASWHLQVIRMLVEGYVLQGFLAIFLGICLAASAMLIGADCGNLVVYISQYLNRALLGKSQELSDSSFEGRDQEDQNYNDKSCLSKFLATGCILVVAATLFAGMIAGTVVDDTDTSSSGLFWSSAAFAPFGALLRWRLSFLNRFKPQFPIGTYVANMLGTLLDVALLTARGVHKNLSREASFFFTALIAGLGGSISSVSTWISEALEMLPAQKYFYVLCTIISAVLLGIIVYGTAVWAYGV